MRKRLAAIVLLMLAVWALPVMAQANGVVEYIDYEFNGDLPNRQYVFRDGQLAQKVGSVTEYKTVGDATGDVTWSEDEAKWYVVSSDVTINGRITVNGVVNLILKDDATLNAKQGITVHNGSTLTIYAQSENENTMGRIVIPGDLENNAGIGGIYSYGELTCGIVIFNGGRIIFTQGESENVSGRSAAGIGGARDGSGGTIFVNGGIIEGIKRYEGACIGGGWNGTGGVFTMNGGVIQNLSSEYGAAIGGGRGKTLNGGNGGTITINGGKLNCISSADGACIGGGSGGKGVKITINGGEITLSTDTQMTDINGAGIGGGNGGKGGNITINGGTINMIQDPNKHYYGAGIGGGSAGYGDNIVITGGSITSKRSDIAAIGSGYNAEKVNVQIAPAEGQKIQVENGSGVIDSYYEPKTVAQWNENQLILQTLDNGFKTVSIDTAPQTKTMIDPALRFEVTSTPAGLGDFTVKYKTGEQEYSKTLPTGVGTYDVLVSRAQTINRNTDNSVNPENSFKRFTLEIPGGLKIIKADRGAPKQGTDFAVGDETYMGLGDGWLKPQGADALEYRLQGAVDYKALDSRAEGLVPGVYEIRFAETDKCNASPAATVTVQASTNKTDVQLVKEAIEALPDSVKPDDVDTVTAIRNAQKLFLALGEQERGKIEQRLVEKLNALIAAAFRYVIVEGDGASVMADSKTALRFVANGPAKWLQAVEVDGSTLAKSRYTVESGSTIVTLNADYVASLPAGEHTLTLVYKDGSVSAQFSVIAAMDLPQTGDSSNLLLWAALALLCAGGVITLLAARKRA